MLYAVIFLTIVTILIIFKLRAIALRNNLDSTSEKKLSIIASLAIIFITTNLTLPYPQSLYWFVILGLTASTMVLLFDVVKNEFKRFLALKTREKAINILFYSLLIVVTNLYI